MKIKYEIENDSVKAFINENYFIDKKSNFKIQVNILFYEYESYCKENKFIDLGKNKFNESLTKYFNLKKMKSGHIGWYWKGLSKEKPKNNINLEKKIETKDLINLETKKNQKILLKELGKNL